MINYRGTQYRSAIFYHDQEQQKVASEMIEKYTLVYGQKLSTSLEEYKNYSEAEGYHQDYLTKNPHGYECPTHFEQSEQDLRKRYGGKPLK